MTTPQALFAALLAINLLDVLTTLHILKHGGYERNKLLARLMLAIGPLPAMLVLKVPVLAGIGYALADMPPWLLGGLVAFYVYVVVNNLRVIRGLS